MGELWVLKVISCLPFARVFGKRCFFRARFIAEAIPRGAASMQLGAFI